MQTDEFPMIQGQWWVPGLEEHKVQGTFHFTVADGGILDLSPGLRGLNDSVDWTVDANGSQRGILSNRSSTRAGRYDSIVGIADGVEYTLLDGTTVSASGAVFGGHGKYDREKIRIGRALRGVAFNEPGAIEFTSCSVLLRYATTWADRTGIEVRSRQALPNSEPNIWSTVTVRDVNAESVDFEGFTIALNQWLYPGGDGINESSVRQEFHFNITSSVLRPISEFSKIVDDLQNLVSIGSGRTAQIDQLEFYHPSVNEENSLGQAKESRGIHMLAQWQIRDVVTSIKPLERYQMPFTLSDMGGMSGVKQWLESIGEHRSVLARAMATKYSPGMFVSDKVLNCAAALEGFDKARKADKVKDLAVRLRRSAKLAGDPFIFLVGNLEAWICLVVDHRNDVAHHYDKYTGFTLDQSYIASSLWWLLVLCLARLADMPDAVFERIQRDQRFLSLHEILPTIVKK